MQLAMQTSMQSCSKLWCKVSCQAKFNESTKVQNARRAVQTTNGHAYRKIDNYHQPGSKHAVSVQLSGYFFTFSCVCLEVNYCIGVDFGKLRTLQGIPNPYISLL